MFEGEEVIEVWESVGGDYWVISEKNDSGVYGFAYLSAHPQFAEWGYIDYDGLKRNSNIGKVKEKDWTFTGPERITITEE